MKPGRIASVLAAMDAEVREIEKDSRYDPEHPATVVVNAPLALVQLEMEVRRATIMRYAAALRGVRERSSRKGK